MSLAQKLSFESSATDVSSPTLARQALKQPSRLPCESCQHKDRFLAIISHELRNMLSPIVMALDVCTQTDEADSELLELAAQHARQLSRLVDDLLEASRLSSGKIQLRREAVDMRIVVDHSVGAIASQIKERGQELLVTCCDSPLWLNADPLRLEQVFLNLLNNAVKYTPQRGCIWLRVGRENDAAVFQVRDSGCGIRPELLPYIFDFFSQADDGNGKSVDGGLGVGLAMVKSLVEMHGGTVVGHSDGPGCGSDFAVHLPLMIQTILK